MTASAGRNFIGIVLVVFPFVCSASPYGLLEVLDGIDVCQSVTGNGRLTVGVDACGRIAACRWPGPGHAGQIESPRIAQFGGELAGGHGIEWGLRRNNRVTWLDGSSDVKVAQTMSDKGPVVRTQCNPTEAAGVAIQETFVHSDLDLLVSRIAIAPSVEGELLFYCDAAPMLNLVPEVPHLGFLRKGIADFAAFVDGQTVYHVRPSAPTTVDQLEVERWFSDPSRSTPDALVREGVWMAYTFAGGVQTAGCGRTTEGPSVWDSASAGVVPDTASATGDCASVAAPQLENADQQQYAVAYVAFGSTRTAVDATLSYAMAQGYAALKVETESAWAPVLAGAARRISPRYPRFEAPLLRALTVLSIATSDETGAVVRAPGALDLLALDYPRHSVWASVALDHLGLSETSERHLVFLLDRVRTVDVPGMPAGSLPAAVHGDGSDGLPRIILDCSSVGWLLWALQYHLAFLDEDAAETFAQKVWPTVHGLSTFLMTRSELTGLNPPYAFDPQTLKESASNEFLIAARIGLRSAEALAREAGYSRPEWGQQAKDLERMLKTRALSSDGSWLVDDPLPFWAAGIVAPDDARWELPAKQSLRDIERLPLCDALVVFRNLALLWREQPERLEMLRPILGRVLTRQKDARPNDSLDAANTILTIMLVSGSS